MPSRCRPAPPCPLRADDFTFDRRPSRSAACSLTSSAMAVCRSLPPCRYTVAARVVECPIRSISSRRFAPASAAPA